MKTYLHAEAYLKSFMHVRRVSPLCVFCYLFTRLF